jgi:hypothetical protein
VRDEEQPADQAQDIDAIGEIKVLRPARHDASSPLVAIVYVDRPRESAYRSVVPLSRRELRAAHTRFPSAQSSLAA